MNGLTPLTSHKALQSLIALYNRYSISRYYLHIGLVIALLLLTHNYLGCEPALPRPKKRNTGFSAAKLGGNDLNQLYSDLLYYIILSCGYDIISSNLYRVFWDPRVFRNLTSPQLQPLQDLNDIRGIQRILRR